MIAVAVGLLWAGYALGLWGYCLVRGYCITPADIVNWNYPASFASVPAQGQTLA